MTVHDTDSDATVIVRQQPFAHGQPPQARLICLDKFLGEGFNELEIMLVDRPQSLGRGTENTVQLKYKTLSREHARVVPENSRWVIEDLNSSNGVFVNDEKVTRHILTPGDIVKLASLSFRFVYDPLPQSTQIASSDRAAGEPLEEEDITLYDAPTPSADAPTLRETEVFAVPLSSPAWQQQAESVSQSADMPHSPVAKPAPHRTSRRGRQAVLLVLTAVITAISTFLVLLKSGLLTTQLQDLQSILNALFSAFS